MTLNNHFNNGPNRLKINYSKIKFGILTKYF